MPAWPTSRRNQPPTKFFSALHETWCLALPQFSFNVLVVANDHTWSGVIGFEVLILGENKPANKKQRGYICAFESLLNHLLDSIYGLHGGLIISVAVGLYIDFIPEICAANSIEIYKCLWVSEPMLRFMCGDWLSRNRFSSWRWHLFVSY